MRYMATIYVSDVMEQVALTAEIQGWSEQYGPPETVWQKTYVWDGVGEDDPLRWLARALHVASQNVEPPRSSRGSGAAGIGGPHTLSETGDTVEDMMG